MRPAVLPALDQWKGTVRRLVLVIAYLQLVGCAYNPSDDGYELVWEDDFDGTDLSSQWERHIPSQPEPQADELVVAGGTVTLRTTDPSRWTGISTRGPRQDVEPSYPDMLDWEQGYFEARVRYSDDDWSFPAVWLFSSAAAEAFPIDDGHCPVLVSELDIMEGLVPTGLSHKAQRVTHTLHRNTQLLGTDTDGTCGEPDSMAGLRTEAPDPSVRLHEWHVWDAKWTSTEVCWHFNRSEVGCQPVYDTTDQPMHLILSTNWYHCRAWLYPDGCPPRPAFTELEVDWVRVWQPRA